MLALCLGKDKETTRKEGLLEKEKGGTNVLSDPEGTTFGLLLLEVRR